MQKHHKSAPLRRMINFLRCTAVVLLCTLFAVPCNATDASSSPVVVTRQGPVRGYTDQATNGRQFFGFTGIPFAQPPVGELRFKDPKPAGRWQGTLNATSAGAACPQLLYASAVAGSWSQIVGEEDCLFLNVFTPRIGKSAIGSLPVMVCIHGGAFIKGDATLYPPHSLMEEDIVLVVMQYRLGTLGFLSTEDDEAPGNLGLKDQSLALLWVQQNIGLFGGDRKRVTLFGTSAGAASTHFHMMVKQSQGMFHRAILQSGTADSPWSITEIAPKVAFGIGKHVGCGEAPQMTSRDLVHCLQGKSLEEITDTFSLFLEFGIMPLVMGPIVDGEFIQDHPSVLMKNGEHSKIDLLAGVTKDDGAYFSSMMYSSEKMITDLKDNFERMGPISLLLPDDVDLATQIYHHYFGQEMNFPEQADEFTDLMTDRFFKIPHYNVAQDHMQNVAGSGKRVYLYELRHRGQQSYLDRIPMPYLADPEVYEKWVCHTDDLAYIFPGTPLFRQHENEVDQQLTRTVVKLWTNFAATGNPTPDASLGFVWEAAEEKRLRQLVLQQQPYMTDNLQQQAREFWSSLPLPENIRKHQHKFASGVEEFLEEITDTHFEL